MLSTKLQGDRHRARVPRRIDVRLVLDDGLRRHRRPLDRLLSLSAHAGTQSERRSHRPPGGASRPPAAVRDRSCGRARRRACSPSAEPGRGAVGLAAHRVAAHVELRPGAQQRGERAERVGVGGSSRNAVHAAARAGSRRSTPRPELPAPPAQVGPPRRRHRRRRAARRSPSAGSTPAASVPVAVQRQLDRPAVGDRASAPKPTWRSERAGRPGHDGAAAAPSRRSRR